MTIAHNSKTPEQRATDRSALHALEQHYAWIATRNGEVKARIVDFSPFGLGVVLEGGVTRIDVSQGEQVTIQLERDGQEVAVYASLVTVGKTTLLKQSYTRLGFKIVAQAEATKSFQPRGKRFALSDAAPLLCECEDPSRTGQKAFFTIRDLSIKGLLLETSARNKFLLPNLKLKMMLSIPGAGNFEEEVQVRYVHPARERYLLGCSFEGLQPATLEALGLFCLNFGKDVSYQFMLEEGFPQKLAQEGLSVSATANFQDFLQISALRLAAGQARGEKGAGDEAWGLIDAADDDAQHVCIKLGKRVIASARLHFRQGAAGESGGALEQSVSAAQFSQGFVSVSQIVIDPEFSKAGSFVFYKLWSEIFRIAMRSRLEWMLVAHDGTWPKAFASLGFREQTVGEARGLRPQPGTLRASELDLQALYEGRRAPFRTWSFLLAPLLKEATDKKILTISSIASLRVRFALWASPFIQKFFPKESSLEPQSLAYQGELSGSLAKPPV